MWAKKMERDSLQYLVVTIKLLMTNGTINANMSIISHPIGFGIQSVS